MILVLPNTVLRWRAIKSGLGFSFSCSSVFQQQYLNTLYMALHCCLQESSPAVCPTLPWQPLYFITVMNCGTASASACVRSSACIRCTICLRIGWTPDALRGADLTDSSAGHRCSFNDNWLFDDGQQSNLCLYGSAPGAGVSQHDITAHIPPQADLLHTALYAPQVIRIATTVLMLFRSPEVGYPPRARCRLSTDPS